MTQGQKAKRAAAEFRGATHWLNGANSWTWATPFSGFVHVATNLHAQVFITVKYGSGTPEEAAAWVRCANVTNRCGFKYWEIVGVDDPP